MKRLYPIIISISIFFTILIGSILISTYDKSFYIKQFEANNTYSNEMVIERNLNPETIADEVISYLKNDNDNLNASNHYTKEETIHMKDVKNLFNISKYILGINIVLIIILFAIYIKKNNSLYNLFSKISKYYIVISLIILIFLFVAFTNFSESFTTFHKLLFTNDYWLLDPNTSIIINIMPEEFFVAHAKNIGKMFVILSIILLMLTNIIPCIIKKILRRNKKC